ncbi:MAG: M10 family metallopeptidase C-terminal domain-containing protein [Fuscovulum sp.]|nr:M10 family metallopeptidase C-terminal domain-containing protein [Fuscovulum sp.]
MTTFNINTFTTTSQTLADLEFGFIGTLGGIASSGTAVIVTGNGVPLINNGTIFGMTEAISATGSSFSLTNTGSISAGPGSLACISISTGNSVAASARILNSGTIQGGGTGVDGILIQSGGNEIVNTGTIIGNLDNAIQINGNVGAGNLTNRIVNSGIIIGGPNDPAILLDFDADTVINTGQIIGGIDFDLGNDLYNGRNGILIGQAEGGSGNDTLIGGTGGEDFLGGAGNDTLNGGAGEDTLNGDSGNDLIFGGGDNDIIDGGTADDVLRGNEGDDLILGGAGNDILRGDAGDDTLAGGESRDVMSGGTGADVFDFNTTTESTYDVNSDVIRDFQVGQDIVDLSDLSVSVLVFRGSSGFSGGGIGSVRVISTASGQTAILVDADGNASAEMRILLDGGPTLTASDLIL